MKNSQKSFVVALALLVMVATVTLSPATSAVAISETNTPICQFTRNLKTGATGEDVQALQKFLNDHSFPVASAGPGSPGKETSYFGSLTRRALIKFQSANKISPAVGYMGPITRGVIASQLCSSSANTTLPPTIVTSPIPRPTTPWLINGQIVQVPIRGSYRPSRSTAATPDIIVPTVTTQAASSVTATTATLNGNITATGGADATEHGFAYGTDSSLATVIATTTEGSQTGTGAFTSSISSLSCNTTYYARAYATNSAGTGQGSIQSFLTDPCVPTVTTSAASDIGISTATLNGIITDTGGSDAGESGFAYGTDSSLASVIATSTLGSQSGTASFSQDIASLAPGTLYYFRAYATNSAGTGYGSIQSFETPPLGAPTVTTQGASSITATSATGNGTITSTGDATVITRGVVYGATSSYGATTTESGTFSTGAFTASITSLTCNTLYHYASYAMSSAGTAYGNDQTFTTSACIPTVTTQTASSITQTTATLNGNITATGGANATQHGFA
ncbi:MAG TPA: peptidoglycan-binding domain-containing protein, partial [Candidatus Paceibacterota bacterium]|nr:peptidoglycan-binding domain-containing protein [Candidatus Paceibacterota bacterium]